MDCKKCEQYEQDEICRELVEWLGIEFAKDCHLFKEATSQVCERGWVFDQMLESWR